MKGVKVESRAIVIQNTLHCERVAVPAQAGVLQGGEGEHNIEHVQRLVPVLTPEFWLWSEYCVAGILAENTVLENLWTSKNKNEICGIFQTRDAEEKQNENIFQQIPRKRRG